MVKCQKSYEQRINEEDGIGGKIFKQRNSVIGLELVGKRCFIHNGRILMPIRVVKQMVGFRFCSYIPIRKKYSGSVSIKKKK